MSSYISQSASSVATSIGTIESSSVVDFVATTEACCIEPSARSGLPRPGRGYCSQSNEIYAALAAE